MAPAHTHTKASSLLQVLQAALGSEAQDITFRAMKALSEPGNFRYAAKSGRLEVLVPLADRQLWVRRKSLDTLKAYLDDDRYSAGGGVGVGNIDASDEEYTFWLAQCVHYGLEFATTAQDAKRFVSLAIDEGMKKEPLHLRILAKRLKQEYIEMYGEYSDEEEEDGDEDEDDHAAIIVSEGEDSDSLIVDEDDEDHDRDDDNGDDDDDDDDEDEDEDSDDTIEDDDGVYDLGDDVEMPNQPAETPPPQPTRKPQAMIAGRFASISEVDLTQEPTTSIYDFPSDSDSEIDSPSKRPNRDTRGESFYDAALADHLNLLYDEEEYDQFSEFDPGSEASEAIRARSSSRVTRLSVPKSRAKIGSENAQALPSSSPVCLTNLDAEIQAAEERKKSKKHKKNKQKSTTDSVSQDLGDTQDAVPPVTPIATPTISKAKKKKTGPARMKKPLLENALTGSPSSEPKPQDSVVDSIEGDLTGLDDAETARPLLASRARKKSAKSFIPVVTEVSVKSPDPESYHEVPNSLELPLRTRSPSGSDARITHEPVKPTFWSSPSMTTRPECFSDMTTQSVGLTPSPRNSRYLRQSSLNKKKGAVIQGTYAKSRPKFLAGATTQSTAFAAPFRRNTNSLSPLFTKQVRRLEQEHTDGKNADEIEEEEQWEAIVGWYRQQNRKHREIEHTKLREEQWEAERSLAEGELRQSTSTLGKKRASNDSSPRHGGGHSKTTDGGERPRKKARLVTPSKTTKGSREERKASNSHSKEKPPTKQSPTKEKAVKDHSTGGRPRRKKSTMRTPSKDKIVEKSFATKTSKIKKIAKKKTVKKRGTGGTPTRKRSSNASPSKTNPAKTKAKGTKRLRTSPGTQRRTSPNQAKERRHGSQSQCANQEQAWQQVTYTSNPMAGRRPGSYRLDSLPPHYFRDIMTIQNPIPRPGQSLQDLPPARQIPNPDHGSEPPLELQWVEKHRAFKKRKLDEFMAQVPKDSAFKGRVPLMSSGGPKGLRIEYA